MRISVETAIMMINEGNVIAAPTETVYGLAASIDHPEAVQQIFTLKKRPANNPLIMHLSSVGQAEAFVQKFPEDFNRLAEAFWPGPLTLVVPVREEAVPAVIRAGLPRAALRVPNHPLVQELISATGPIVMPSANLSGKPSSTTPEHVELDFGRDFPVLDGGACRMGIESTVLIHDGDQWKVGRLGGISAEQIEAVIGYRPELPGEMPSDRPLCPGQMYRHYAPQARLHLGDSVPDACSVILGFSDREYHASKRVKILGPSDDPEQVAKNLYRTFRDLDEEGVADAWVDMNFPGCGLWTSIRERIKKAAKN